MEEPRRRIGFRSQFEQLEELKQINTVEEKEDEKQEEQTPDILEGVYYDASGKVFTIDGLNAQTKKDKAVARSMMINSIAKIILYVAIATSMLGLTYTHYKMVKNQTKPKITIPVNQKQR